MSQVLVTASILSADLTHLQDEVDSIADHADWLQIDVMDGQFVPNLSFGAPVIKNLKTKLPLDVHLMVENPADRIEEFIKFKPHMITFHAEAVEQTSDRTDLIEKIHASGAKAGIAINPETPLSAVDDVIADVDMLLIMSVHPGFGGQAFIPEVLEKVREARSAHPACPSKSAEGGRSGEFMIQMDGGVDDQTAPACIKAGANNLVSGSFIFGAPDRAAAISSLRSL